MTRRHVLLAAGLTMAAAAGVAGTAAADHAGVGSDLAAVRAATAGYHRVDVAEAAGYQELLDCFSSEAGGMGQHYVDVGSLDADLDPLAPESMVYDVSRGRLQLVAVEYIVPLGAWAEEDPPELFGQPFHVNEALGLWVLHAWIWTHNPAGMFADFNPVVGACPGV